MSSPINTAPPVSRSEFKIKQHKNKRRRRRREGKKKECNQIAH